MRDLEWFRQRVDAEEERHLQSTFVGWVHKHYIQPWREGTAAKKAAKAAKRQAQLYSHWVKWWERKTEETMDKVWP